MFLATASRPLVRMLPAKIAGRSKIAYPARLSKQLISSRVPLQLLTSDKSARDEIAERASIADDDSE
jgi:hypothetical protein